MHIQTTKVATILVPALLMVYAVARWIDGRDGTHGPGSAWNVGHVAFLFAFLGFGLLSLAFRRRTQAPRVAVNAAAAASLIGVVLFVWVIVTDLVPELDERASLPEAIMAAGPLLFIIGFVTLLALHARSLKVSRWALAPLAALVALFLVGANLDLLPVTSVLLLVALWPVGARAAESPVAVAARR